MRNIATAIAAGAMALFMAATVVQAFADKPQGHPTSIVCRVGPRVDLEQEGGLVRSTDIELVGLWPTIVLPQSNGDVVKWFATPAGWCKAYYKFSAD